MKKRFVILDRDGTIIKHKHHLTNINEVKLIPNVAKAIKKLNSLGLGTIIVTNQSVVGRSEISLSDLELIHKKILHLLSAEGAFIDAIYFCPHKPEDNCSCSKPKFGLINDAIKDHNFDPKLCFVVGDNKTDIELGENLGATTILVKTGYGAKVAREKLITPNIVVNNLYSAVSFIEKEIRK